MKLIKILFNSYTIALYIIILIFGVLTFFGYSDKQYTNYYVTLFDQRTGNLYNAYIGNPVFYNYMQNFNMFEDALEVTDIQSYDMLSLSHIGNVKSEIAAENDVALNATKILPTRKYVDYDNLPGVLKDNIGTYDIYDVNIIGLEKYGLKTCFLIVGESSGNFYRYFTERSKEIQNKMSDKGNNR